MAQITKRIIDLLLTTLLVITLWPLFTFIALLLFIIQKQILFSQKRPGKNEKIFKIYKFQTMRIAYDKSGELLPDEERLTTLGKFLRSTSLDELPQIYSVLKGDLSLVGPRPLLVEYLPLYNERQKKRHLVPPGITGWAQVNGRNAISWEEKFELDVWYVENWSLWLDFKILFLTLKKVFIREGINTKDNRAMPKFKGTQK